MTELKRIYWTRLGLLLAFMATLVWLFGSAILSLMSQVDVAAGSGVSAASGVLRAMLDRLITAVTLPGVIAVVLVITAAIIKARDARRRDPVRRFTRQQRRAGMARAGGVCEMEAGFGRRCSRPAEHGDHFYPWSKGGSTSLQNFVAACSRCNRTKGARIPSPGQQLRLERRRRTYVPLEGAIAVGERHPLPQPGLAQRPRPPTDRLG